ncbi:metallo-beta-lactamase family protein [Hyphomonas neptunium ATCC 15444]|uniref:Metallo-beta-lactamase family protein n=2 Tax=Hyphomonas TaxID=85 RepID=Q0C1L4_HYPNA|nr:MULTISPECIES: alkyl sulfatase dimerization domain-containing protein [Hyphomonas]ABI77321.1 metallo-beta-lactamase family protein [Hyphomonas neptunium ATCC 15444]KCZ92537.1 metallo-beta-lactamase family protein [Hyphomonas hirschiana VP5]
MRRYILVGVAALLAPAITAVAETGTATQATIEANRAFSEGLPWDDTTEAELSDRGFVATREDPIILGADGEAVFDLNAYDFTAGPAAETMNPSLWRHLSLLKKHGLYEVTPGIWQVRGFDLSVMSIIEGETGFIIVDPLTVTESAAAAFELVKQHLGDKPIHAVIYTHSHADHFGGVKGIVTVEDVAAGKVQIIAPDGFMEHAVSENLIAGGAMSRRANFQFGSRLEPGPAGQGGAGIGTGIPRGTMSLIPPTHSITETGETMVIDGIEIEFQLTPGTEAPAELNFYLPQLRALCLAENANATMHNVLPPRGSLVRDAKAWADYLTESIALYADKTDVMFVSHGWPRWGQAEVTEFMSHHRDAYKFLHDQTIRLMNKGYTASEIAEVIALPESLSSKWYNRGYYGTMAHNSKAVYQRYLGWYDGNPANLNAWPPEEAGKRYVAAMGGAAKALAVAQSAYNAGDYRWAAQVASHIVFADDTDASAREVLAKAFEQMGYQAEGSLWRNMYLTGAAEARETPADRQITTVSPDMIGAITTPQVFDMLAIRVDPAKAEGIDTSVAFVFPDREETRRVSLRNSVLVHEEGVTGPVAATVTIPRPAFLAMLFAGQTPAALMEAGIMKVEGEAGATAALMSAFEPADTGPPFEIVTP